MHVVLRVVCGNEDVTQYAIPGLANMSIAIDRSIAESKLVDHA